MQIHIFICIKFQNILPTHSYNYNMAAYMAAYCRNVLRRRNIQYNYLSSALKDNWDSLLVPLFLIIRESSYILYLSMLFRIITAHWTFMQGKDFSLSKKKAYQDMIDISIKQREQYIYSRIHSINSINHQLHTTIKLPSVKTWFFVFSIHSKGNI